MAFADQLTLTKTFEALSVAVFIAGCFSSSDISVKYGMKLFGLAAVLAVLSAVTR